MCANCWSNGRTYWDNYNRILKTSGGFWNDDRRKEDSFREETGTADDTGSDRCKSTYRRYLYYPHKPYSGYDGSPKKCVWSDLGQKTFCTGIVEV